MVCPGYCDINHHVSEEKKWVYKQVEETWTLSDVRKKYDDALSEKNCRRVAGSL